MNSWETNEVSLSGYRFWRPVGPILSGLYLLSQVVNNNQICSSVLTEPSTVLPAFPGRGLTVEQVTFPLEQDPTGPAWPTFCSQNTNKNSFNLNDVWMCWVLPFAQVQVFWLQSWVQKLINPWQNQHLCVSDHFCRNLRFHSDHYGSCFKYWSISRHESQWTSVKGP